MQKVGKYLRFLLNYLMILLASGILGVGLYGARQSNQNPTLAAPPDAVSSVAPAVFAPAASVSSAPVNTAPSHYQQLAETAIAQGKFEDAASILEEGIAATGAKELTLQLEALDLTIQMPEYKGRCWIGCILPSLPAIKNRWKWQ